ncbi:4-hydroxybenzoate polyprenyltransferase [Candidatus Nitrotoga sp. HW29]|uniref:UbiA family prenyltransferase n=1 Tax=Candidatus Nitrotoga sp. HW29 TaxID=2886963 RepID=UPI001EF320F5|nr:UbiA family prenyltransferase [Candidatus Nitrotoga sp. HW29]CAH1904786.1 4-hydroxybenzoate polyprenyltransferase [Candidatus Nitrotoga sp. HW29]
MNQSSSSTLNTKNKSIPLIVDLDGTLTPTDTLIESIIRLVKNNPLDGLKLPFWMLSGRAVFKSNIATRAGFSVENLPYRQPLVDYLHGEKEKGRRIILATAAHRSIADSVAKHLGLFDGVLASDEKRNLKGKTKLEVIRETVGERFVYAGDSAADLPIWKAAEAAILVGTSSRVSKAVRRITPIEREFPRINPGGIVWLRALRVHQWLKNLLLFVPLLTAFSFLDGSKLTTMIVAFFAFSLAASATYVVNDLWDLENDRSHPRKRNRPFANASITIPIGISVAAGAMMVALILAACISNGFLLMLILYITLTSTYSWVLKEYVLIDVLMLSLLYTLRILAGAVAISVPTSSWLLAFSVFIFFSLALVKRCSELVSLGQAGREAARGRDYRVTDLIVLWPLGIGAALCAVVVFGLFISAAETQARYGSAQLLWFVAIGLIYWLARLWIKTARGEMHDDPLVFALKDSGSRMTILAMLLATLVAHFIHIG